MSRKRSARRAIIEATAADLRYWEGIRDELRGNPELHEVCRFLEGMCEGMRKCLHHARTAA